MGDGIRYSGIRQNIKIYIPYGTEAGAGITSRHLRYNVFIPEFILQLW
jgi:hypothetical protein